MIPLEITTDVPSILTPPNTVVDAVGKEYGAIQDLVPEAVDERMYPFVDGFPSTNS